MYRIILLLIVVTACSPKEEVLSFKYNNPCDTDNPIYKAVSIDRLKYDCNACKEWKIPEKESILNLLKTLDTINNFQKNDFGPF